jgi:hypothetical protein
VHPVPGRSVRHGVADAPRDSASSDLHGGSCTRGGLSYGRSSIRPCSHTRPSRTLRRGVRVSLAAVIRTPRATDSRGPPACSQGPGTLPRLRLWLVGTSCRVARYRRAPGTPASPRPPIQWRIGACAGFLLSSEQTRPPRGRDTEGQRSQSARTHFSDLLVRARPRTPEACRAEDVGPHGPYVPPRRRRLCQAWSECLGALRGRLPQRIAFGPHALLSASSDARATCPRAYI